MKKHLIVSCVAVLVSGVSQNAVSQNATAVSGNSNPLVFAVHGMGAGNREDGWSKEMANAWKIGQVTEVTFRTEFHDGASYVDALYQAGAWAREVQKQIESTIAKNPGRPIIIVSHSWGTVATALALRGGVGGGEVLTPMDLGPGRVKEWMTLGSPLGMDLSKGGVSMSTGRPFSVDHWTNVYDVKDPVSTASHSLEGADNVQVSGSGRLAGWLDPTGLIGAHANIWTHLAVTKLLREAVDALDDAAALAAGMKAAAVPVPAKPVAASPVTPVATADDGLTQAKAEADAVAALAKAKKKKKEKEPPPPPRAPQPAPPPSLPPVKAPSDKAAWNKLAAAGRQDQADKDRQAALVTESRVSLTLGRTTLAPGEQMSITARVEAPPDAPLGNRVQFSVSRGRLDQTSVSLTRSGVAMAIYTPPDGYAGTVTVTARVMGLVAVTRTFTVNAGEATAPSPDGQAQRPATTARTEDGSRPANFSFSVAFKTGRDNASGRIEISDGQVRGSVTIRSELSGKDQLSNMTYTWTNKRESTFQLTGTLSGDVMSGTFVSKGAGTEGGIADKPPLDEWQERTFTETGQGTFEIALRSGGSLQWVSRANHRNILTMGTGMQIPKDVQDQIGPASGTWTMTSGR